MAMPEDLDGLEPFVGQWRMGPSFTPGADDAPHALTSFEWLSGRRFLIQRWEVDHPEAPDGIAIIGFDRDQGTYLQHYFDSRGVERVYRMSFVDRVWTLERMADEPDFSQRFTGRFSDGGDSIVGRWATSHDRGTSWSPDFDLTYTKVG
jgi:hypothetical protein